MSKPNRLKEQRERSRLSQSEVAKFLDVGITTVSRHENSNRTLTREMVEKYATLYKISAAELFLELPESVEDEEDLEVQEDSA